MNSFSSPVSLNPKEKYRDAIVSVHEVEKLGISDISVNTAWLGRAGLSGASDLQMLAVPEAAIAKALGQVSEHSFTILNFHHPLSWHIEHASQDFQDLVSDKVNLSLCGHVHDPRPMVVTGESKPHLINQSGALYTGRQDRYLGYSLLRVQPESGFSEITWRSYFDRRREFDVATNIDDRNGRRYSSPEASKYFSKIIDGARTEAINVWVHEKVLPLLIEASSEGMLDKPTSELFVAPPLSRVASSKSDDPELNDTVLEHPVDLNDVVEGNSNYLVEAYPEHGKASLLIEICRRVAENSKSRTSIQAAIPIYLPFSIFVPGTKRVEKAIRDCLPGTPPDCDLNVLLDEGCFTVCIDDVVYSDVRRIKELRDFVLNHKSNRFILTATSFRQHDRLLLSQNLGAHFEQVRCTNCGGLI